MGAHDYIIAYAEADRSKIEKMWNAQVEEDKWESGSGSYAGNATTFRGSITFYDRRFSTENEARRFCLDKHEKWTGPVAVSYFLPSPSSNRDEVRVQKAEARYQTLYEKALDVIVKANESFRARKSKLIGCSNCGSRLSKEHYLKRSKGHVLIRTLGWKRKDISTFACPICDAILVSETIQKRVMAHKAKLEAAEKAIETARAPKPSKRVGWCVGGWAAS